MISVKNLSKSFGYFQAVDNLSFEVKPGDIVGFLGPNGAGKSTTMKMLTGFLQPDEGEIHVGGKAMEGNEQWIQSQIGYLPEGAPAYDEMTPLQFLDFIGDIRGLTAQNKKKRIQDVVRQLELTDVLHQPVETLSKGFKRRVGLAQAILHDPHILILDEPTDGLDPNQKHQVRALIQGLSRDKMVIISTHILEEVSAVCNRAMILAGGEMRFDSTPDVLQQRSRYYQAVTLTFEQWPDITALKALEGVSAVEENLEELKVTLLPHRGENIVPQVSEWMAGNAVLVTGMVVEQGRLDQIFRELTAKGPQHD